MSTDDETVLMIRGAIASLPPAQREACEEFAEHLRRLIMSAGIPVGPMALALVGAELQAKNAQE